MSLKMTAIALAIAIAGALSGVSAWSQTASSTYTNPELKLIAQYEALAGSRRNAESLITGLRDGKNILLITDRHSPDPRSPSVTFVPDTGKLGYGNINIALSLAAADLARLGITNPTPTQLEAALNGGTIRIGHRHETVTLTGVLAQRQSGMGWGQIANAMGVKLGTVVSASKTDKARKGEVVAPRVQPVGEPRSPRDSDQARVAGTRDAPALKTEAVSDSGSAGKSNAPASKTEASGDSSSPGKSDQAHSSNGGNKGGNSGSNASSTSGTSSTSGNSSGGSNSSSTGGGHGNSSSNSGGGGRGK